MDNLQSLTAQVRRRLFLVICVENILLISGWWAALTYTSLSTLWILAGLLVLAVIMSFLTALAVAPALLAPVRALWQAIVHLSPQTQGIAAPDPGKLHIGHELVTNLMSQIYQLATLAEQAATPVTQKVGWRANFIANNLPLPLIVLDSNKYIMFANNAAGVYLDRPVAELIAQNFYSVVDMSFPNNDTFDSWLTAAEANAATASKSWERVRLTKPDGTAIRQFDLAAYYNKNNPDKIETMVVMFDHTERYAQDDQAMSFVALSVHELRTPLTLLRGYIEVFDEELGNQLTPELKDFMVKMNAAAQQLTAFVSNILNVARVEDNQLVLQLHEDNWADIIRTAANNMALRAHVRGITLEYSIAPDLPPVGVDRVSIYEVIDNLLDNAIKYSGDSKTIRISTFLNDEQLVETSVQDYGVGIPASVLPNLFTKFYRNHRNRAQIGGTGLGLYLSKAIVSAHGGNIWVNSKEGEGSTFSFTVLPYAKLADEMKNGDNKEIVRGAHGWIKNHSLYRR